MASNQNGNVFDDDEFGDFGGFEAADPAENVAPVNAGGQAAPSMWAALSIPDVPGVAGARNVQPDLLCGQNRFPQHLDTPQTVDVASSAQASVPTIDDDEDNLFADFASSNDVNLNLNAGEGNQMDLVMANDILDGSFRSSSGSQAGPGILPHPAEHMPDISGLDLAAGIAEDHPQSRPISDIVNNIPIVPSYRLATENGQRATANGATCNLNADGLESANQEALLNQVSANQINEQNGLANQNVPQIDSLLQRANEEKENLQKELEERISDNEKLSADLAAAESLAESTKQELEQIQSRHAGQLEELREAGHTSLTMVVEEYKASMASCVQQQLDTCQRTLVQGMREETDRLRQLLMQQKEDFDSLQREERRKNEEKLQEAVKVMKEEQQVEVEKMLAVEKTKFEKDIEKAIQLERESSERKLGEVVKDEQDKAKQALEVQQETFEQQMNTETAKQKTELDKALREQRTKHEEELAVALREERGQCEVAMQKAAQTVRDDMNKYLLQQRDSDRALQCRHLASLDLFLATARQQLDVLMDTNRELTSSTDTLNNPSNSAASDISNNTHDSGADKRNKDVS